MKFRTYVKLPEPMRGLEVPPEGRAGWATQSISGSGTEDTTQHVVRIEWDLEDGHLSGFARALSSAASRPSARSYMTSSRCGTT
jgi:hypothetical protein